MSSAVNTLLPATDWKAEVIRPKKDWPEAEACESGLMESNYISSSLS